ncbi:MAG: hypothetical protein ACLVJB_05935 [Christensenellales bacterium]
MNMALICMAAEREYWRDAANEYEKRLRFGKFEEIELPDSP